MSDSPMLAGLSAAGRAIPVALLASLPGLVFLAGFDHLVYGLGLLAGIVLAGLLIAPQVIRSGAASIPEALHRRFGLTTAIAGAVVIVLVLLPLLSGELALLGVLAEAGLGVPYVAAVVVALVLGGAALALSERAFGSFCVAAYVVLAASLLVPLILMAAKTHGLVVPQIGYGQALTALSGLEEKLLENGLVDFDTFSLHVAPFLRLSQPNMVALVVSLALGTAVLPQLALALSGERRPAAARIAGAWTALFVMLILMSVPALAAYAKLEVYGVVAAGTPLASLPQWLDAPLKADLAHIHGTSLAMLEQVAKAGSAGATDPSAIADYLAAHSLAMERRWLALDEQVRTVFVEAARAMGAPPAPDALWQTYVGRVLPTAATAAANDAVVLTQAALVIEPLGLLLALPALSGAPRALVMAGVIAAALVFAQALIRSMLPVVLIRRLVEPANTGILETVSVLVIAAVAAGLATLRPE
jgi:cation/acetate symporter